MYYKYPRTPHLPWSPGVTSDDKVITDLSPFEGKYVSASLKMDGEATTMYQDYIHARSVDSKDHPSRHWVKALHAGICHKFPNGVRVCGENLFAKHTIHYEDLRSYFLVYSMWKNENCFGLEDTNFWAEMFGLHMVPVIWEGKWSYKFDMRHVLAEAFEPYREHHEGYVVRIYDWFRLKDFGLSVAKYVRKNHVQTDQHWMERPITPNKLIGR